MTYAMVCNATVLEVVDSNEKPIWPPTPSGDPIIAIECDGTVSKGMMYDYQTQTFLDIPEEPKEYREPTEFEQLMAAVSKSHEELRQEGATALTMELIERGVL